MNFYLTSCRLFRKDFLHGWRKLKNYAWCWGMLPTNPSRPPMVFFAIKKMSHFKLKRIATFIKRNSFKPDNTSSWTFSIGTTRERNKKKKQRWATFHLAFFYVVYVYSDKWFHISFSRSLIIKLHTVLWCSRIIHSCTQCGTKLFVNTNQPTQQDRLQQ